MDRYKKIGILIVVLLMLGAGMYFLSEDDATPTDFSSQETEGDEEDLYVYEFDAESAEECTSVEEFDEENSVCYFECDTDEECDELLTAAEAELDGYLQEYEESSPSRTETKPLAGDDIESDADYSVAADETITLQTGQEASEHKEVWSQIKAISPDSLSANYIETFRVFSSPEDDTIAYVEDSDDNGKFVIAVNLSAHNESSKQEQILTFVHELAHIVTLNKAQIAAGSCEYETDEGCFGNESLLAGFVEKFWSAEDVEKSKDQADLYSGNESKFVTEYAATNPEEDIAESFAYYTVKSSYVGDGLASQKQAYFDSFEEAKNIKKQMRKATLKQLVRARVSR